MKGICEHCGARITGEVCEYCDMPTSNAKVEVNPDYVSVPEIKSAKKNIIPKIIAIVVVAFVLKSVATMLGLRNRIKTFQTVSVTESQTEEVTEIDQIVLESNTVYQIGVDIPKGTYFIVADSSPDSHARFVIYEDSGCSKELYSNDNNGWFDESETVTLEGNGYLKLSYATAFYWG